MWIAVANEDPPQMITGVLGAGEADAPHALISCVDPLVIGGVAATCRPGSRPDDLVSVLIEGAHPLDAVERCGIHRLGSGPRTGQGKAGSRAVRVGGVVRRRRRLISTEYDQ